VLRGVGIGLVTNKPAAPGRGILLGRWAVTHPGALTVDDSEIELSGMRVGASGTATVSKGLKGGTLSLHGRDNAPTGVTITGSWTCGEGS
jgi:hypothetical protein